jgi:hypothetical protein
MSEEDIRDLRVAVDNLRESFVTKMDERENRFYERLERREERQEKTMQQYITCNQREHKELTAKITALDKHTAIITGKNALKIGMFVSLLSICTAAAASVILSHVFV